MVIINLMSKKVLLHLLKDFSSTHTITTLAKELGLTRVGVWKILKRLEGDAYIVLKAVGKGKTSTYLVSLNWENPLVDKALSLFLTEEAIKHRRWQMNFSELENVVNFAILYGSVVQFPQESGDIDILGIASKKNFVKIQLVIDKVQKTQSKKIHSINFTESEFKSELRKPNKAFIDAVRKGIVLLGQENFVNFMNKMAK